MEDLDSAIFIAIIILMIANGFGSVIPDWVILGSVGYCLTRIIELKQHKGGNEK